MEIKTLDKRLRTLEKGAEPVKNSVYIYYPKVGVPEDVNSSYIVFLPNNGR